MGLHRSSIINWYRTSIGYFLISGLGVQEQWHGLQDHQAPETLYGLSGILLKLVSVSLNYRHQKIWRHVSHSPVRKLTICFHKCIRSSDKAELLVGLNFIIIIVIRHELGLDRPVSASSNSLVKGLPSRLRPFAKNSALFLSSCFCSFLLHVVVNLICIFLVSRQLVLLSALPKLLHSFYRLVSITNLMHNSFIL